jgi:hypothetical protein
MKGATQFVFEPDVPLEEAEMTLHLAMFAVEGLAGRVRVCLDAKYLADPDNRSIYVTDGNRVAKMVVHIFTALLFREFGEDAFQVSQIDSFPQSPRQERTVPA